MRLMSALRQKADLTEHRGHVREVPIADIDRYPPNAAGSIPRTHLVMSEPADELSARFAQR
jgi:hypothetical protein